MQLARQSGCEIEAESVDVHFQNPIPQAVHDQFEHLWMTHVQRVAGAGVIHVVTGLIVNEPVIGCVVHTAKTQRGAEMVAFGRVVVNHVQDHFDAGAVERLHHALELGYLAAVIAETRIARLGREEVDAVIAPIIPEAAIDQGLLIQERVDRHQLHCRDPQIFQVIEDNRMSQAGVGAADLLGNLRMAFRESLDVHFVDHLSWKGVSGGRSLPQSKSEVVTTPLGTAGASSRSSRARSCCGLPSV